MTQKFRISRIDPATGFSYEDGIGIYERNSNNKGKLYFRAIYTPVLIFLRAIITIVCCDLEHWVVHINFFLSQRDIVFVRSIGSLWIDTLPSLVISCSSI